MPGRNIPLVNGEVYHIFNRGVAEQPIFNDKRDYLRFMETWLYYRNISTPVRYSRFISLPKDLRDQIIKDLLLKKDFAIDCLSYCLMPTHFHFLLKQIKDNGISEFMSLVSNSYSRYFNTRNDRSGPLLQGKFKAVRIITEEQYLHVSRYIHLNPYTSHIVKDTQQLILYPYSSLREYLELESRNYVEKENILSHFKNTDRYKEFILNQADYQKTLHFYQHLALEK